MEPRENLDTFLRGIMHDAPDRPANVSLEDHAMAELRKHAALALKYEEQQRSYRLQEVEAQIRLSEENTRYYVAARYLGICTTVKPDQQDAFCKFAGLSRKDWDRMVSGAEVNAGEWSADIVSMLPRWGKQLCQPATPKPSSPERSISRVTKPLVTLDWTQFDTLAAAEKHAAELRKPLPYGALMASY